MTGTLLLGLDVGTSAVKAAVLDERGAEVAHGRARTPWRTVPTGAELDPHALLDAVRAAASEALAAAPAGEVAGVGVASMGETGVLLDRDDRPVVPAIAWHDSRGEAEARRIAAELDGFSPTTGLPPSPMCTLAKYAWMRGSWPASDRGVRWLNVAEWVVHGLGGAAQPERSLASRTGFYDLHACRPWDAALALVQAPARTFGEPVPAGTPMGTTTPGALAGVGAAVLTVAGHDHLAAAIGAGAAGEDEVLNSCGTAEALVRAAAPLAPDRVGALVADGVTVGWHAEGERHALLGAVWAGSALQPVLDLLGVAPEERGALEAEALHADPGTLALRDVTLDEITVGGLRRGASPGKLYRAALEAAGAEGAGVLARMAAHAGPHRRLVVTGGWAAGQAGRAVKARHLGPFEHSHAISTGARGAALLAGRATGARPLSVSGHRKEVG